MRNKGLWLAVGLTLLLSGCASTSSTTQQLELFFSPEQTSLNAEQQRKVKQFFDDNPYHQISAYIAPANISDPFKALVQSQKRMQAINRLSASYNIPLRLEYAPKQDADTLLLKRL
ncbi:hypothetical protein A3K86_09390 [Photobacterium jeanii]|uniref:Uncharacterized protein n=1 Tax=Photobacterium jeanii TaxID=858640 RepID=A0A178KIJ8_9GAMM|nr:hypothetical protein [Photobacterium jeanii]OAN16815.1 hypothetical protein A3K86_09390 [Photobacterium jeanii]PST88424.1 hypothetical protein C9I91_17700 [Photobacterium jeanii]